MIKIFGTFVLGALLLVGLSGFEGTSSTIANDWVRLGSKKVDFKLDRDIMQVGIADGRFAKLKLVVSGGSLNMHKMVVLYGNGSKEEIEVRHNFNGLSTTRVIDLNGNKRIIKKIMFIYDTKNASKRKAKVHVFGRR